MRYEVVESLLLALDLEPNLICEVTLSARDRSVTITHYRLDPDSFKFVDPETGEPAVEVEVREIVGLAG